MLAVHPNGRTLASIAEGGRLHFWHRETGRILLVQDERLRDMLAFTTDGRYLHGCALRRNHTVVWTATTAWPATASSARPAGD
jgi:uncharacterized protein YjhX (UPF0386 family)